MYLYPNKLGICLTQFEESNKDENINNSFQINVNLNSIINENLRIFLLKLLKIKFNNKLKKPHSCFLCSSAIFS